MNSPSSPFAAPYRVDLIVNFNDQADDQRRIKAENWCCHRTKHRWFRRVLTRQGIARFEFDDQQEAALFRLFNP